jgi:hypothetical protein
MTLNENLGVRSALDGEDGFHTGFSLSTTELEKLRRIVKDQWLEVIGKNHPEDINLFEKIEMNQYHLHESKVNHSELWPKINRILSKESCEIVKQFSFFRNLEKEFGLLAISDEEDVGREEMYWRLVRPHKATDIGPIHADYMFWDLGHGYTPEHTQRIKVWIPLYCERGVSGFQYMPGSHKKNYKYKGELRSGMMKPIMSSNEDFDMKIFDSNPGEMIVFHDRLLHGGVLGGDNTRVSLEMTIFVSEK